MKLIIIFSAIFVVALATQKNERRNSNFAAQMVRSNDQLDNPSSSNSSSSSSDSKSSSSSSSSESEETLPQRIKNDLKILKTKFYNALNCTIIPPPTLHELRQFFEWTLLHNRTYGTAEEKFCRTIHLIHNFREINEHNKLFKLGKVTWKRGLTDFSDLTAKEKIERLFMKIIPHPNLLKAQRVSDALPNFPEPRATVDYVQEGLVGPVGMQQRCGSCWAWSSAATLEGQLRKCRISSESVSVQSMVDCVRENCYGCDGGWPYFAMKWAKSAGIVPESKYPYQDYRGYCVDHRNDAIGYVDTPFVHDFNGGNADYIKRVVSSVGPVVIALCADAAFTQYHSGVYYVNNCCTTVNHAITLVGYGTDPVYGNYWLIKNSWGRWWGQNGFAKIARGYNLCQSENTVHYAQIKDVRGNVCRIH